MTCEASHLQICNERGIKCGARALEAAGRARSGRGAWGHEAERG